ncbi:MAG: methylenetetrahydromethanopterin dehydrogenase [Candidatus Bathyarchaeota archaeon]|jgi:methylene-tetrahydromethanopterin dehydrogenase
MQVLEIKPLTDKQLKVIIIEKEYNEPFWIVKPSNEEHPTILHSLFKPSIAFQKFMEKLLTEVNINYATEELGIRSQEEFIDNNILAQICESNEIPFFPVDIDENAKSYIATSLEQKAGTRDEILRTLSKLGKQEERANSIEHDYMVAYGQCLQLELEEEEREISFPVRENWIVMGILENAKRFEEKEITCLHISSPEHVEGIKELLTSLDISVESLSLSKNIVSANVSTSSDKMSQMLQSMQIQVRPIIKKGSHAFPYLLFYLDTDEIASPFDICMAYDAGYNAVIPYDNVTAKGAEQIVQDTIFSRGPKAVKNTCFFIGGRNIEKAEEVLEVVETAMFPPFNTNIVIDPGGAYTTASSMVAKVEDAISSHNLGDLREKTCTVLGTGSVGRIAAVILAKLGCDTTIASLNPNRKNGLEYAEKIAKHLSRKYNVNVSGVFAPTSKKKLEIIKEADVIFCAATRGARILDMKTLNQLEHMKVLVDINAVKPLGIEGINLKDDMREITTGIFAIGALTVGELKHELEKEVLRQARISKAEVYNYTQFIQTARKLLEKKITPIKLGLTLKYSPKKIDST